MRIKKISEIVPDEEWNEDYCTELGHSFSCPKCDSDEVSQNFGPALMDKLHAIFYECENCDHRSFWFGDDEKIAMKRYGHPLNLKP